VSQLHHALKPAALHVHGQPFKPARNIGRRRLKGISDFFSRDLFSRNGRDFILSSIRNDAREYDDTHQAEPGRQLLSAPLHSAQDEYA
jgi:hypothetical protein